MCGIAGIITFTPSDPVSERQLRQMLAMLRHRGPDQFGIYLGDGVGLGNARLSIIDLGGGQQPIANEDESLWIVFNGEIFNYVELRAELEARGHRFTTHCDTEVILHLYEDYGPECLNRLNGQFAIAIWNERDRSLFLARDRVGVRPVFYSQRGSRIFFASEIKAILSVLDHAPQIDPVALADVFTYWSPQSPRTAFRHIQELPPGHYALIKDGRMDVLPFWRMQFSAAPPKKSIEEYAEEFESLLFDATRIRLRADVPVGAYLSGGLDSSTIAAIVRKLGVSRLETFSIAFSDPRFDESEHQKRMAAFLGTDHKVVYATHEEIGRVFPEVIWHTEAPLMRTAPAPMFLLSKLVRDTHFKVVLTGEGADEFLAGYDIFKEAKVRRFWAQQPNSKRRPLLLGEIYPDISDLRATGTSYLSAFFGAGLQDVNSPDYSHAVRWRNTGRGRRFFSEDLENALGREPGHGLRARPAEFESWDALQQAQYLEVTTFLSPYLLSSQGDRVAMAHSVEGRYPFLDARMLEFCNRLPSRLKLRVMKDKFLLRTIAKKYLPEEIVTRPKRPYRAPIHRSFFHQATPEYVRHLLSPEQIARAGLFKPAAVAQLVAKLENGRPVGETDDMALAGILSTQLLHQQFIADFQKAAPLSGNDDVKVVNRQLAPALA
jgi:asparagine synthase (glutamine-hydrolysing)